jgi:hypothetical protein
VSDDGSIPRELPLLVGRGGDEPETLLLLGVPRDGRVTVRRWSAAAWDEAAEPRVEDAAALLRWVEAQASAGRSLNQSVYGVRLWLRGEGTAPGSR